LVDAEGDVLAQRLRRPGDVHVLQPAPYRARDFWRPDGRHRVALGEEVPGTVVQRDHGVALSRDPLKKPGYVPLWAVRR
jgi:hypothetical protein